jgi:uncharacterized protein
VIAFLPFTKCRETAQYTIAGMRLILDMSGALYMPDRRLLVVADMHLEKATSGARRGIFLPPYDSRLTLEALTRTVKKYTPSKLVFLGDSFHDAHAPLRLDEYCSNALQSLKQVCEMIWITGNHDPKIPQTIATSCINELSFAGINFTHIPHAGVVVPQISGHLHPVVTVSSHGRKIRRRCFATDGERMILPAFGAYTGGLNVKDKAFDGLFKTGRLITHVIGNEGVYSLPVTAGNR